MTSTFRKFNLTAHITAAVAGFLVLSIAGLLSHDAETVRGAYLSMNLVGRFIIVPLSLAALVTGVIQSLGTHWGLFRHYWVLVKFALSIVACLLLLLHQFTAVAGAARRVSGALVGTFPVVGPLGMQLVGDAGLAVLVLLVTTTLSVYKPWGRTHYSRRQKQERRETYAGAPMPTTLVLPNPDNETAGESLPLGLKIFLVVVAVIAAVFAVLHHLGGGLGSHGR
jgi:hypothetical protein